jgi:hypothetical protein
MTLEEAMAQLKVERDLWQAYQDAQKDAEVMAAMNKMNPVVATPANVEEHKAKASELLTKWHDSRKAARASLDLLLVPFGLSRSDLASVCS